MAIGTEERLAGDSAFCEEFEAFYGREFRSVVGLAYVLSGSKSGAEDLAQDAFLAALSRWERIARYDDPGAWVRRVVANRAVSRFRRIKAEAKALLRFGDHSYTIPDADPMIEEVGDAVRQLPKRQAQVVALRFFDRRSIAEIAAVIGCSENTVKTHLKRAKKSLAQRLGKEET